MLPQATRPLLLGAGAVALALPTTRGVAGCSYCVLRAPAFRQIVVIISTKGRAQAVRQTTAQLF
jgi:hypothetical protein